MAEPQITDDAAAQFLKAYPKKVTTKVDKPAATPADDAAAQFLRAYPAGGKKAEQPQPPGTKPKSSSGFLTTSVFKLAGGSSASELYQNSSFRKVMEGIIPESAEHDDPQSYVSRFLGEAYHAMPESIDFITSPAGIGLMALHTNPYTRLLAPAVDYGLAAYAGVQASTALNEFRKDKSPENLARIAVALAGAYMGVKSGDVTRAVDAEGTSRVQAYHSPVTAVAKRAAEQVKREGIVNTLKETAPYTEEGDKTPNQTQILEAKVKVLDEIAAPKKFWDKVVAKASTAHLGIGDISRSVLRVPTPELMQVSSDLVQDRAIFETTNKLKVGTALHAIEQTTTPEDRMLYTVDSDGKIQPANKIPAVIQKTVSIEKAGLSPGGVRAVDAYRNINHESDKLRKEFYGADVSTIDPDEYVTQIWDIPKDLENTSATRAARTLMRDRFNKARVFEDIQTGIAAGWKPKFNDLNDVVRVRHDFLIRSIANQRLANTITDIGGFATRSQRDALHLNDWVLMEDTPAINRAAYQETTHDTRMKGRGSEKHEVEVNTAYFRYDPVYAHPQLAPAAQAIFAKKFSSPGFVALDKIRRFGKLMNLRGSLFHEWAITEQAQALTASQQGAIAGLKKWWFTNPEVYKGGYRGIVEVIGKGKGDDLPIFRVNNQVAMDGVEHGLKLEVADAERSTRSALQNFGKDSIGVQHAVTAPLRAMGHLDHIINRSLWDFYLPSQMIHSYGLGVDAMTKTLGENATPEMLRAAKRAVADQVNDAYGAISWEKMLVHPKVAQVLNWIFLAPGWKASNIRVYSQIFEGPLGFQMATNYLRGAAVTWFIGAQVGNYISSAVLKNKDKDGNIRPHFTWDNPGVPTTIPGVSSNFGAIAAGLNPNGSEKYINWGKGLVDPIHLAMDPRAWFANAESGPLQALGVGIYGVDPVTGYEYLDKYGSPYQKIAQGIEHAASTFVPFSIRDPLRAIDDKRFWQIYPKPGGIGMLFNVAGLPTRQGLNYTRATEAYISAMKSGDHQAAMIVLKTAQMNQLSPRAIDQEWRKYAASERKKGQPLKQVYGITGEVVK